jgi:hypothetical protein
MSSSLNRKRLLLWISIALALFACCRRVSWSSDALTAAILVNSGIKRPGTAMKQEGSPAKLLINEIGRAHV